MAPGARFSSCRHVPKIHSMTSIDPQETSAASLSKGPSSEAEALPQDAANPPHQFDAFRAALVQRTPFAIVTPLLILANVAVFGLMVAKGLPWVAPDPEMMIEWGANFGPRTLAGEEWRLAASMFLHFGLVHLGMNMLALWNVGRFVERLFGNVGFLLLYGISGLAGSVGSVVFNPDVVSAGASGAIFGVAGGLLGGAWKLRKSLPPPLLAAVRWIGMNVLFLLVIFAVVNHFHPIIDNAAHVAGCLSGVLIGLVLAEPISHDKPSRRGLRNLIVAALGTAAGYGALTLLPAPPADAVALQTRYQRVERDVNRTVDSAMGRLGARAITVEEYADILENDVLSRWTALREEFESAGPVPKAYREVIADLQKVIELYEAGWQLQIEALRENDPQKGRKAQESFDEASEIIRRLNQKGNE